MLEIDIKRLRRDYTKEPLVEGEYLTKEEFGYLYLELNMSFEEIDIYLGSVAGTALKKNRRKPNAKKSDKFGFKKSPELIAEHMRKTFTNKTGLTSVVCKKDVQEKIKNKNKENWKNNKEEILSKMKNTMLERYGVENASQSSDLLKKAVRTKFEKYCNGNNNEKIKETKLKKYGDSTFLNKEKREQTNLEKFGSKTPFGNSEIKNKVKCTLKERYGVENIFELKEFQEKAKEKRIKKFNVPYCGERHISHFEDYNKEFILKHFVENNYFLFDDALEYFNINQSSLDAFKRRNEIYFPNKHTKHQLQNEVYEFIKTIYNGKVLCDTRKIIDPLELDIYIPDMNVAIEFDGLKYHSVSRIEEDNKESKMYHLNKTLLCREKGVKLFHIFENEWLDKNKKEIWKSVIKNALNIHDKVIYARQCRVQQVSNKVKKEFLEKNHLQGNCQSSINLGLFYKEELVSLMTFGKSRFNKNVDFELLRFCSKIGYQIRFAASKLLKTFERKNKEKSLISYANQRWSNGELYSKLGFVKSDCECEPSYFYFNLKDKVLLSRYSCQKHLIRDKLELFDNRLSESENMFNNNYYKIYDCGSLTFLKFIS